MSSLQSLAIIGSGPSCIYLLKHLLQRSGTFRAQLASIEVFEKGEEAGTGMPYSPATTDRYNMSNISSEELPVLTCSFADWLRELEAARLEGFGIAPGEVRDDEVYPRLALGAYFRAQYLRLAQALERAGIPLRTHARCKIVDVREDDDGAVLCEEGGREFRFDRVAIATGHYWPEDDEPERGYYVSPWPIAKLLPKAGERCNFTIGTLGASLSAFDVVTSLAHRHGRFDRQEDGRLVFHPHPDASDFKIVMHAADGLLPHLQYAQARPLREIERHVRERELLALRDAQGFLRLDTYFDRVCRPVLATAFAKNGEPELAAFVREPGVGIVEFCARMKATHQYDDPFAGMRAELSEASASVDGDRPIHWKENFDDLMYTLNFYAEYLPAEDHLTLQDKVLPCLMNVIAALPLPSAHVLLALHEAGRVELCPGRAEVEDAKKGERETRVRVTDEKGHERKVSYRLFVNCAGQKPLEPKDFPFPSLERTGRIRAARAPFLDPAKAAEVPAKRRENIFQENGTTYYAKGGVEVDRNYALVGKDGRASQRIFDLAFQHISGERPYSYGLQACDLTARLTVEGWAQEGSSEMSAEAA